MLDDLGIERRNAFERSRFPNPAYAYHGEAQIKVEWQIPFERILSCLFELLTGLPEGPQAQRVSPYVAVAEHTIKPAGEIEIHRQRLEKAPPMPQEKETFFMSIMPVLLFIHRAEAHTIEYLFLLAERT
jgi:hypothetical protein